MKSDVLHQAWTRLDQGISVIPLVYGQKRPAIDWSVYQKRRPTHGETAAWFGTAAKTRYNLGAVMGQISRLVALDADSLEKAVELYKTLPRTAAISKTARGAHFLYQIEEGQTIPTRIRFAGQPIDVKGEGSYIVLPPSIHPTGQQYEWVDPAWNLKDVPYFDPSWIEEEVTEVRQKIRQTIDPTDNITKRARAYLQKVEPAVQGAGGHATALYAASCLVQKFGLSPEDAWPLLLEWNDRCSPAWDISDERERRDLYRKLEEAERLKGVK